jgi:predicted metal-dependent hydrolase
LRVPDYKVTYLERERRFDEADILCAKLDQILSVKFAHCLPTVHARARRLSIAAERVRRRWRRLIETWRRLRAHMTRHSRLSLLFLRRSQPRTTLTTALHDTLKEVRGTMADSWWWWLRRPAMRAVRCATSGLELTL